MKTLNIILDNMPIYYKDCRIIIRSEHDKIIELKRYLKS